MSMDEHDSEWKCFCGHTTPDYNMYCSGCGKYRYYGEKAEIGQTALDDLTDSTADRNYSGSDTSKITNASEVTK